ncbi:MAG: asparagine synthase (glutamine-hydrolyzing) [Acidobacteria bacterium]|nr:MAG: asparagine synthase (glutamine-hydrolyzing) [Acidobacteriota bacterium]
MCGIAGILNLSLDPAAHLDRLEAMSARLVHRGPDSHGAFTLPHLGLAIRRLSIIDLETGDQPLSNETGEVTLVFNGEIYNYRELRKKLLDRGHRFKTRSDGEVIAHLYEERGPDFVRELNGMFAIALWDNRAKRLVLARDRAGEKPLYYWRRGTTLAFASEIKALFEYPDVSRAPDFDALTSYFFYGYFPAPASAFREIRKLPAAHRMVVEGGEFRIEQYWRLLDFWRTAGGPPAASFREEEVVEELRGRIREAARSRLVSDVPLGVFLSGGVDSSTLAALMSELTPQGGAVNSFSVSFREKSFNEEPNAEQVAKHFHTRHHSVDASEAALRESLLTLAGLLDEPLADPAVLPTHLMSGFARREIKVAFSGEGSDELFGGYPTYLGAKLAAYYLRLPGFLRRQFFERLARHLPVSSSAVPGGLFLRRFFAHAERKPAERHLIWFGMFAPAELEVLFSPGWPAPKGASAGIFAPLKRVLEGAHFDDVVAEMLFLDFRLYLEDNLLVKTDRASMACSLELRSPYLDHRLVEFAAGLPSSVRLRGFELKSLMKKAVEKWLPPPIVYRQKRGFSVPIADWMRGEWRPLVDSTLAAEKLKRQGLFDTGTVRGLLNEHWAGRADNRKTLWTLLTFQLWFDRWVERN